MKNNRLKVLFGIQAIMLMALPALASTDPNAKPAQGEISTTETKQTSDHFEGKLRCTSSRNGTYPAAFVALIRKADGEKLSINNPSLELQKECERSDLGSVTYHVDGRLTSKVLFWGS
jgi:hypothetical protein